METELWKQKWNDRVGALASAAGKKVEQLDAALKPLIGEPSEGALNMLGDENLTPFGDLRKVLCDDGLGLPVALLRQFTSVLRGRTQVATAAGTAVALVGAFDALPEVKEDDSFMKTIKAGGVLKIEQPVSVLFANRAGLADQFGLFEVPEKLVDLMLQRADELSEPCGKEFYSLLKLVRRKRYAEVLEAMDIEAAFVTKRRKTDLIHRVKMVLWVALRDFHRAMRDWKKAWLADMGENQMLAMAVALSQRTDGTAMPEGLVTPPDTGMLYDAAEAVNDAINTLFSGMRLPVAVAMATEAKKIKELLDNKDLPQAIGATTRDEMLRILGVAATANDVRLEQSLARFTLAILLLPNCKDEPNEYKFLSQLFQLGQQIKWDELLSGRNDGSSGARQGGGTCLVGVAEEFEEAE